ncbi:MAG: AAA family ATPase [Streptosporangiaceae bacterium]
MTTTTYDQIEQVPAEWLWRGLIPMAGLTLIAGPGGVGKGMALVDLAARVSNGAHMPDGSTGQPAGDVVMITPEDDSNSTVSFRLAAAHADPDRISDAGDDGNWTLPDGIGELRELVDSLPDPRLVILDPLLSACTISLSTNLAARRVLGALDRIGRETGCAILVSRHVVKSGSIAGSRGLTDAARTVLRIERAPENPAIRLMSIDKANNIADTAAAVRFRIAGEAEGAHVEWLTGLAEPADDGGAVLRALRAADGLTVHECAVAASMSYRLVRIELAGLERRGLVERNADGTYSPRSARRLASVS